MTFTKEPVGIYEVAIHQISIRIQQESRLLAISMVFQTYFLMLLVFIFDIIFTEQLPSSSALQKTKQLLECGVKLGELDKDYILLGARQLYATESPGLELYGEIQDWNHWSQTP